MNGNKVIVGVEADTTRFDDAMQDLTNTTKNFGNVFSSTIRRSIQTGRSFEDTIRSIGKRFADIALNKAFAPVENLFGNILGSLVGSATASPTGFRKGDAFANSAQVPFARGGIVTSPVQFGFGNRLGIMGEAGPEAIMPLKRGTDGKLGVAASTSEGKPVNVVFNVSATDAASFRKSEGQITAMLARAVARGRRGL